MAADAPHVLHLLPPQNGLYFVGDIFRRSLNRRILILFQPPQNLQTFRAWEIRQRTDCGKSNLRR